MCDFLFNDQMSTENSALSYNDFEARLMDLSSKTMRLLEQCGYTKEEIMQEAFGKNETYGEGEKNTKIEDESLCEYHALEEKLERMREEREENARVRREEAESQSRGIGGPIRSRTLAGTERRESRLSNNRPKIPLNIQPLKHPVEFTEEDYDRMKNIVLEKFDDLKF